MITVGDSFAAGRGEGFYGFGGRHGSVNKHGEKLYGYTEQENLGGRPTIEGGLSLLSLLTELSSDYTLDQLGGAFRGEADLPGGFERYMAPNGPNAAYYPQAQFVSSAGYGFLLNQDQFSRWRMGNDRDRAWQVQASARKLDYTVALGPSPERATGQLTEITGRHLLPPRWAQGPTVSRAVQVPSLPGAPAAESPESYRAKIEQDLADIETYDVQLSAYAFEGWALVNDYEFVRSVIDRLHAQGIKVILYHRAYVANDTLSTQPPGDYAETMEQGLVATTADGAPYIFGANGRRRLDPARLHQPEDEGLVARAARADARSGHGGLHAGLRRAGAARHALRRRQHRPRRCTTAIRDLAPRSAGGSSTTGSATIPSAGRSGSLPAPVTAAGPATRRSSWATSPATRPPTGAPVRACARSPPTCSTAPSAGPSATPPTSAATPTSAAPPPEAELFTRWSEWAALTPLLPRPRLGLDRDPDAVVLRRRDAGHLEALASLHQRALPLIRELWKQGRNDRDADHPADVARRARAPGRRRPGRSSGCWGRTCLSPLWS